MGVDFEDEGGAWQGDGGKIESTLTGTAMSTTNMTNRTPFHRCPISFTSTLLPDTLGFPHTNPGIHIIKDASPLLRNVKGEAAEYSVAEVRRYVSSTAKKCCVSQRRERQSYKREED